MINLGNGVYAINTILPWDWVRERGHAGIVTTYTSTCTKDDLTLVQNYQVIEMGMHNPQIGSVEGFTMRGDDYWGIYTYPNKMEPRNRLKVIGTAKFLLEVKHKERNPFTGEEVWVNIGYPIVTGNVLEPENWNRSILNTITTLRCDGLVELCYEWNDINLWGKLVNGTTHHNMIAYQQYLDEHNETSWAVFPWQKYLFPATQCAHNNLYQGEAWNTTFCIQKLTQPDILGR